MVGEESKRKSGVVRGEREMSFNVDLTICQ